jgi:hypothetical protein
MDTNTNNALWPEESTPSPESPGEPPTPETEYPEVTPPPESPSEPEVPEEESTPEPEPESPLVVEAKSIKVAKNGKWYAVSGK